jgi:type IV secretion system protein VirD4
MRATIGILLNLFGPLALLVGGIVSACVRFAPAFWERSMLRHGVASEWLLHPPLWAALGLLAAGVVAIAIGGQDSFTLKKTAESTSHGSARFSTTQEVRDAGYGQVGVPLCMEQSAKYVRFETEFGFGWVLRTASPTIANRDLHTLVEGPAGSGKDECVVLPALLTDVTRSYVVNDPKGLAYERSAGYRSIYTVVKRFAPSELGSARYNPLLEIPIGTDREVAEAERIASSLAHSAASEEMSSRIYLSIGELLLTAGILYVVNRPKTEPCSLPAVLDVLTSMPGNEDKLVTRLCAGLPADARLVAGSLRTLAEDDRMLQAAFTTVVDVLKFCRMPTVAAAISGSDFLASDLSQREKCMTLYAVFPFRDKNILRPLARLFFDSLLSHHRDAREHDTVYLLNELESLGKISAIPEGITEQREQGVRFVLCVQSEQQLFSVYGEYAAKTILDNCRARVTLGVSGQNAAENASKRLGKATLVRPRQTQAVSRKSLLETTVTNTKGEGEQARELRTPDEIRMIDADKVLVELPGVRPYLGTRMFRYAMPELKRRSEIPAVVVRSPVRRVV